MSYLLICMMLIASMQTIYGMHKDEGRDDGNKRDFNYLSPENSNPKPLWLSHEEFGKMIAAGPRTCVDVLLLRRNKETGDLEYFVVKRKNRPAQGFWWFPGGGMHACEEIFDTAERKCQAEGNILAASFHNLGSYRTRFPDSSRLDSAGEMIPTDTFNFVVIAFYNRQTEQNDIYEDAEEIRWVNFNIRPSSLPMPSEEERQGVDVAYLDQAFDDAHRILDPLIAEGSIDRVIEDTLRARGEHGQALSARQASSSNAGRSQQPPVFSPLIGTDIFYAATLNANANDISLYSVNRSTGEFTPVPGSQPASRSVSAPQSIPSHTVENADDDDTQFSFDEELVDRVRNAPFAQPAASEESQEPPRLLARPGSPLTILDFSQQAPSPRHRPSLRQSTANAGALTDPINTQESDDEEQEVEERSTSVNSTQGSPPQTGNRMRDLLSAQLGEFRIQEYLSEPKGN